MATIVDVLETQFRANTTNFEDAGRKIAGTVDRIGRQANRASGIVGSIFGVGFATTAVGAIKYSLEAASGFDTLARSLAAVTGSGQRTRDILSFVDKLAVPSIFTSAELGEASKSLEAYALQTEKYLPIVEKLGTVFGGTSEDLAQFVRALGMLRGGRAGEAFESLARAGISRTDLQRHGLQFNKGGELLSDPSMALAAVESEVNRRFGNLTTTMGGGNAAKMATMMDAANRSARLLGGTILGYLTPGIVGLADTIQKKIDSGELQQTFENLVRGAIEFGKPLMESVVTIGQGLLPVLTQVAEVARTVGHIFVNLPTGLQAALTIAYMLRGTIAGIQVGGALGSGSLGGLLQKAIVGPIGLIGGALIVGAMSMRDQMMKAIEILEMKSEMEAAVPGRVRDYDENGKAYWRNPTEEEADAARRAAKRDFYKRKFGIDIEGSKSELDKFLDDYNQKLGETGGGAINSPISQTLEKIERNTRPLLSFQQYTLGDGEFGQMAVTATEMANLKGMATRSKVETAVWNLVKAIRDDTKIESLKALGSANRMGATR